MTCIRFVFPVACGVGEVDADVVVVRQMGIFFTLCAELHVTCVDRRRKRAVHARSEQALTPNNCQFSS